MTGPGVNMGAVWDRATEFLGDNLPMILPIALVLIFVPLTVQGHLNVALAATAPGAQLPVHLAGIVLTLISSIGQLAIMALAIDPDRTSARAIAMAGARLPALALVIVVLVILAIVVTAPVILILLWGGVDMAALATMGSGPPPAVSPGVALSIAAYGVFLLVLALWAVARLAVVYPVLLEERLAIGAIGRSLALTKGKALKIIGVLLLLGLVGYVAVLAARTVFGSIFVLLVGPSGPLTLTLVLTEALVALVAMGFTVLSAAFTAKLYLAARAVPDKRMDGA